jgi:hypothetical protein
MAGSGGTKRSASVGTGKRSTTFVLSQKVDSDHDVVRKTGLLKLTVAVNRFMDVEGHISPKDAARWIHPSM